MNRSYQGDASVADTFAALSTDDAVLVDVRTSAEWNYVGGPDPAALGGHLLRIEWQSFPGMAVDPAFGQQLERALADRAIDRDAPIYFLCRSGARSAAAAALATRLGFTRCFNVADGFEGPLDAEGHRGRVAGWKAAGLPWRQG